MKTPFTFRSRSELLFSMERMLENIRFSCTILQLDSIIKRCGNGKDKIAADVILCRKIEDVNL